MMKVIDRFKEPSTYAGLMGLAIIAGVSMEQFEVWTSAAAGAFAFVALVLKETGSEEAVVKHEKITITTKEIDSK